MEEASVAGESPDRSKQRESSAEPTSGSAGPVPEARPKARDPRLPATREGGTDSTSRGGVDTATRVFSVRRSETGDVEEAEDAGDGTAEDATDSVKSSGPTDTPSGSGTDTSGNARLRAAVAAWVQSADDKPATEPEQDTPSSETVTQGTGEAQSEDAETAETAEGAGRADVEADGDARDAETAEAAERDGQGAEEAEEASTGAQGGESASAGTGEAERASGGAQEAEGGTEAAEDRDAEDAQGSPVAQDTDETDAPADEAEEVADAEPRSDADADPEADAEADAGSDAGADEGTDPDADSDSGDVRPKSDADAEAEAEADDTETPAKPDPRVGTSVSKADADADAKPVADPKTDADEGGDEDADESEAADGEERPSGDSDDSEKPGKTGSPAVDQPTAVFKAPRVGKREVDQPTTMLKLGDAATARRGGKKPDGEAPDKVEDKVEDKVTEDKAVEDKVADKRTPDKPAPGRTPEAEAERTSKFVALKPLDDPSTRKPPPPPADATTALPRVKPADATSPVPQIGPERTTQQPLPPKPPLDLLAELTNTPPPPETPLRTTVRRVKVWTPIVLLLAVVFAIVQAVRPLPSPSLVLTAEESYTFKGDKVALPWPNEGQGWMDVNGIGNVDGFGEQKPVAIGSVAKAMTAYVVLKDHPLKLGTEGPSITIDALAEKEGGYDKYDESTVNTVKKGDKYTLKQALSAVMIPSANNIARLLARWDAGNEAAFIKKMNATAKELGMKNTKYTDASGLKETTVSTAEDQVKLGHELVKIPALMDITKQPNWVDPTGFKWRNYNDLVPYNNAIGIKTGSTSKAGGNLLFAATKEVGGETVTLVGAILAQHNAVSIIDQVNKVSKTAMLATQDALTSAQILKKGDVVGYVDDKFGNRTPVVVTKDVSAVGWAGLKVKLSFATDDVPHTAKAGTKVGSLTVGDGSGDAVKVPVALQKDLAEPGFADKLTRVG
nr:D-alanyl-D-alanine carboxypeptidase [Streptomyces griseus]